MIVIVEFLGYLGMLLSFIMMFVIPRDMLTNGIDMPIIPQIGIFVFIVSILAALIGAFCSSELGLFIISAMK